MNTIRSFVDLLPKMWSSFESESSRGFGGTARKPTLPSGEIHVSLPLFGISLFGISYKPIQHFPTKNRGSRRLMFCAEI
jgi:hypothetical protein